jgi:hypothetical protein
VQKTYLLGPHVTSTSTAFSLFPLQQDKALVALLALSELAVQVQKHELAAIKTLPANHNIGYIPSHVMQRFQKTLPLLCL